MIASFAAPSLCASLVLGFEREAADRLIGKDCFCQLINKQQKISFAKMHAYKVISIIFLVLPLTLATQLPESAQQLIARRQEQQQRDETVELIPTDGKLLQGDDLLVKNTTQGPQIVTTVTVVPVTNVTVVDLDKNVTEVVGNATGSPTTQTPTATTLPTSTNGTTEIPVTVKPKESSNSSSAIFMIIVIVVLVLVLISAIVYYTVFYKPSGGEAEAHDASNRSESELRRLGATAKLEGTRTIRSEMTTEIVPDRMAVVKVDKASKKRIVPIN